jgi:RimJ/RimL family protein N-acetyltransferase
VGVNVTRLPKLFRVRGEIAPELGHRMDLADYIAPVVRLVPFDERHITPRYISWLNDPEVVRLSEQRHKVHTGETCRVWLGSYINHPHNRIWAIEVEVLSETGKQEWAHVGNVTALADPNNHTCEVSNLIGETSYWGKGIGTEACRQAINHMLDEGYRKVWIGTLSVNKGELRIMEKLGMEPDCVIRGHFEVDGTPVDEVRCAVFAPNRV